MRAANAALRARSARSKPKVAIANDGTLHVRDLVIAPSGLWSPEFKRFYARKAAEIVAETSGQVLQTPARRAAAAEWDEFHARMEREVHAEPLAQLRRRYAVDVVDTKIAGIRVGVICPHGGVPQANARRVLINLRGGGFVFNRGLAFGQIEAIPVAAIGGFKVVTVDYRQSPTHRYPAASEDVERVYRELTQHYNPRAIGIFGCSAGGILAAQSLPWLKARGLPCPGAVGIFSIGPPPPYVPGSPGWGESALWFSGLPKSEFSEIDQAFWEPCGWYMEGVDPADCQAWPGSSDAVLAKFPPTLLLSGTRDFAMSATVTTHARLLKLGVDASLYIMEGGMHGAHAIAVGTPEAHDAQTYISRWFDRHLER